MRLAMTFLMLALFVGVEPVQAIVQYQKVFLKEFIADHPDKDYAKLAKRKARCNLCHQGKKDRTKYNRFGEPMIGRLDHEKDKKDKEKILLVLQEVVESHSDPNNDSSPTFAELIADSKLPGGPLEESLEEPEGVSGGDDESGEEGDEESGQAE